MNPLLIISIVWLISEILLARMKASTESDHPRDRSSLRILWITITLSVSLGVFLRFNDLGGIGRYQTDLHFVGLGLILLGLAIRWSAIMKLKKYFTVNVAIRTDHMLVQDGIYKYIRHPAYTGSLLSFLGLGLALVNWLSLVFVFFPILGAFVYRISVEEKVLRQQFPEAYATYSRRTKRLIPGIF